MASIQKLHHSDLKVLFVCVGNSCRSPMAESVLKHLLDTEGIVCEVDSAAIADWNIGRDPEPRCLKVLAENGLTSNHKTRQITKADFYRFDYIFGMDDYNIEDLKDMEPAEGKATIQLLGSYDYNRPEVIVDPYFDRGDDGFYAAYTKIFRSCKNFLKDVIKKETLGTN